MGDSWVIPSVTSLTDRSVGRQYIVHRYALWTFPYVMAIVLFQFLVLRDVHRVKIQINHSFWQVSRSCLFSLVLPLIVNLNRSKMYIVISS